jgi:hypothetical protein
LHGRGLTSDVAHDKTWSSRHGGERAVSFEFSAVSRTNGKSNPVGDFIAKARKDESAKEAEE